MTRPIQSSTPAMSDQHSERFEFSSASLASARIFDSDPMGAGRDQGNSSDDVDGNDVTDGRCALVKTCVEVFDSR